MPAITLSDEQKKQMFEIYADGFSFPSSAINRYVAETRAIIQSAALLGRFLGCSALTLREYQSLASTFSSVVGAATAAHRYAAKVERFLTEQRQDDDAALREQGSEAEDFKKAFFLQLDELAKRVRFVAYAHQDDVFTLHFWVEDILLAYPPNHQKSPRFDEPINLGAIEILLKMSKTDITFEAQRTPKTRVVNGYIHPHIANGRICLGDAKACIYAYLKAGRFLEAVISLESMLRTYNPRSPYLRLEHWYDLQKCGNCGEKKDEGAPIPVCGHCGVKLCPACAIVCPVCGGFYCANHSHEKQTCEICGKESYSCQLDDRGRALAVECTICGKTVCRDCLAPSFWVSDGTRTIFYEIDKICEASAKEKRLIKTGKCCYDGQLFHYLTKESQTCSYCGKIVCARHSRSYRQHSCCPACRGEKLERDRRTRAARANRAVEVPTTT